MTAKTIRTAATRMTVLKPGYTMHGAWGAITRDLEDTSIYALQACGALIMRGTRAEVIAHLAG